MKRVLLLLLLGIIFFIGAESCSMRYPSGTPYKIYDKPHQDVKRHFGARKNYWPRREARGRGRSGYRPHSHRGWYRQ